ncbi:hypothetical protein [Arthrobacter sp. Leaf69]|uniref:hypothetical protein n=1 Tax=Arthrobacter sp. Leaf69 TaxID=1736232 RepID=UPI0006FBAA49|nr:hypothetical protein [Arthrobacter sp. Leaf69]KQN88558.1 hypothetical protein ASE96_08955 [Arthrobacter sp. Leaf69]
MAIAATVSCSAGMSVPGEPSTAPTAAAGSPGTDVPVTAEINQLRDNYSRRIIAIQLTNTTARPVTVLGALASSPLFSGTIEWPATPGGIELPPGQTKILPAPLSSPDCGPPRTGSNEGATVALQLAEAKATGPAATVPATDPYGVLSRNNAEICLALAVSAVAGIRLEPELEVSADGQRAVLGLAITPRSTPGSPLPGPSGALILHRIDGTTLIDEDPVAPWPRSVAVHAGGAIQHFRLGIRPARCDPHAIADDKVGTLLPLRVSAGGRDGVVKIDAGGMLRGRIHDFVSTACGRQ